MMMRELRGRWNQRGISLVELLVGVALLAVVVVSLVASSMYASRTLTRARIQLESAEFLQSELERLLALPYEQLADGTRTLSKGTSSWTAEDSVSYRRLLLVTHYAPNEGISEWDTVVSYRLKP